MSKAKFRPSRPVEPEIGTNSADGTWIPEPPATDELTALRQQVADLRAALAPFAALLPHAERVVLEPDQPNMTRLWETGETIITVGHIRNAVRVLAATQPQEVQP